MTKSNKILADVLGKIFDGRWKVVGTTENGFFKLENIYNHEVMTVSYNDMVLIFNGEKTVNDVRLYRVLKKSSHKRFVARQKKRIEWYEIDSFERRS